MGLIAMKELKGFGFKMGIGLNMLGLIMFAGGKSFFVWFIGAGILSFIFAAVFPGGLAPVKKTLDFIMLLTGKTFNAAVSAVLFYLIFVPMAILFKFLRKDALNRKIDKSPDSYWTKRKKSLFTKDFYEHIG